jgi:hypothetical protein
LIIEIIEKFFLNIWIFPTAACQQYQQFSLYIAMKLHGTFSFIKPSKPKPYRQWFWVWKMYFRSFDRKPNSVWQIQGVDTRLISVWTTAKILRIQKKIWNFAILCEHSRATRKKMSCNSKNRIIFQVIKGNSKNNSNLEPLSNNFLSDSK